MTPLNLDAVELFLELNRLLPAVKGTATQVLSALARQLPASQVQDEGIDGEAAVFLVPTAPFIDDIGKAVRRLATSHNPVARHIREIYKTPAHELGQYRVSSAEPHIVQAELIVTLSRGDFSAALALLEFSDPALHPLRALRIAVRHQLRLEKTEFARDLQYFYRLARLTQRPNHPQPISDALEFGMNDPSAMSGREGQFGDLDELPPSDTECSQWAFAADPYDLEMTQMPHDTRGEV